MKQTLFGTDQAAFQKKLRFNITLCILVFCAVAASHVVCTGLRTEQNHTYMLIANITVDVIGGSFLIARLSLCVFPQKKLLQLFLQANQQAEGQVLEIGSTLIHYIGVDCYEVSLSDRRLFLPADTMTLTPGKHYRFRLKGNLMVEVCDDEQA